MSSTVSHFFSRDTMLKRHARTSRIRNTDISKPLHIIVEEDEQSRAPSSESSRSRSPSPSPSPMATNAGLAVKARRRHANLSVSDIRIARDNVTHDDNDVFTQNDLLLLSAPRPAPRPPTSPVPSPDSFRLTFTDVSYKFPHPPIPTPTSLRSCASPTSSASSSDSSPCSRFGTLPHTPSTSDDEFALPSPRFNPRRAAIKPLVIAKLNGSSPSTSFNDTECPISASLLQPFKNSLERPIPLSPSSSSSEEESFYESDEGESDSEWYNKEFSKILTLPTSPTTHQKPSRPESMFVPRHSIRYSKPLPLTPPITSPISPAFFSKAAKRQSRRSFIPNYPPPPIPTLVRTSSASSSILSSSSSSEMNHLSSPFPTSPKSFHSRAPYTPSSASRRPPPRSSIPADCGYFETDDQGSVFSLSLYEDDIEMDMDSRGSACSFSSESDDFRFDVHMEGEGEADEYPPSLPSSPNSADLDIATSFEHAPTSSPSPSPSPMLKSKWSSSTIGSIREEHERRGPSAKLRLYFGGGGAGKRGSKNSKAPQTPTSTSISMKSPSRSTYSTKSPRGYGYGHGRHGSDVMIIGYGHGHGVRRRGSVTPTISDAGSDDSALSSASSGLRRKPIPLMLLSGSA